MACAMPSIYLARRSALRCARRRTLSKAGPRRSDDRLSVTRGSRLDFSRRLPGHELLDAIIIQRPGLAVGRQAEIDDLLRTLLRRIKCHGIFARHCGRAHASTDRSGVEHVDAQ